MSGNKKDTVPVSIYDKTVQVLRMFGGFFREEKVLTFLVHIKWVAHRSLEEIIQFILKTENIDPNNIELIESNERKIQQQKKKIKFIDALNTVDQWLPATQEYETQIFIDQFPNIENEFADVCYIYTKYIYASSPKPPKFVRVTLPDFDYFIYVFYKYLYKDPYVQCGAYFDGARLTEKDVLYMDCIRYALSICMANKIQILNQTDNSLSNSSLSKITPNSLDTKKILPFSKLKKGNLFRDGIKPEDSVSQRGTPKSTTSKVPSSLESKKKENVEEEKINVSPQRIEEEEEKEEEKIKEFQKYDIEKEEEKQRREERKRRKRRKEKEREKERKRKEEKKKRKREEEEEAKIEEEEKEEELIKGTDDKEKGDKEIESEEEDEDDERERKKRKEKRRRKEEEKENEIEKETLKKTKKAPILPPPSKTVARKTSPVIQKPKSPIINAEKKTNFVENSIMSPKIVIPLQKLTPQHKKIESSTSNESLSKSDTSSSTQNSKEDNLSPSTIETKVSSIEVSKQGTPKVKVSPLLSKANKEEEKKIKILIDSNLSLNGKENEKTFTKEEIKKVQDPKIVSQNKTTSPKTKLLENIEKIATFTKSKQNIVSKTPKPGTPSLHTPVNNPFRSKQLNTKEVNQNKPRSVSYSPNSVESLDSQISSKYSKSNGSVSLTPNGDSMRTTVAQPSTLLAKQASKENK